MSTVFFISDLHMGHGNSLGFKRNDGMPLRDFKTVEEMDDHIITSWNSVVGPKDKVYLVGDVVINRRCLYQIDRLNGDKVLYMGNHDIFKNADYAPYFRELRAFGMMDRCIISHVPVHTCQLERFRANIHGHTHSNYILGPHGKRDNRYFNVSCDCDDMKYIPKSWDEIQATLVSRGIDFSPYHREPQK